MSPELFNSGDGWAFIQFESGKEVYPLGNCIDADALPNPQGDRDPIQCLSAMRQWETRGWNLSPPGKITTTLTSLQDEAATWLERVKETGYRFNLYLTEGKCNTRDVFGSWRRCYALLDANFSDDPVSNVLMRGATSETEHAFNITAMPNRIDTRRPTVSRIATTETAALNDIWFSDDWREKSAEGPAIYMGQNLIVACDTVAAAIPDVGVSNDSGATWATPATTFVAAESVMSCVSVRTDCDTVRLIAVRDTRVGVNLSVEYSDSPVFAAPTEVILAGGLVAEAASGGGALFALDAEHIWLCTDDGEVYFSGDAAASWTRQPSALAASGANALFMIKFVDANVGMAVGAADRIIMTEDGGTNWVQVTATGGGDGLLSCHMFDAQRFIVGTDGTAAAAYGLYQTFDQGASWTNVAQFDTAPGLTDDCMDVTFCNELSGMAIIGPPGGQFNVYQTVDGGYSFQRLTTPTNVGLNSIAYVHPNLAYAVGELSGTSVILQISA